MRIVYVSADRGIPVFGEKGASVHVQEMMHAFRKLGHDICGVVARRGDGPRGDLIVEEVSQATGGTSRSEKEQAAIAQADMIEARLIQLFQDWPFDLIYERYSLWSAAGCRAGRKLGVPVVTEVNAPLILEQAAFRELACEPQARAIEAAVLQSSDALAAVSQQMADYLVDQGADPSRVQVIRNAVDTGHFQPGTPAAVVPSIPDDAFVIGFTGSLKMWHGVDTLMTAFRQFRLREPRAHLLICGDGPKKGWIEGFVAGADLSDFVTMAGWVDHADLPGLIACMDIATAPYPQSDAHYFSPLKLFEYLAMGVPVVASDIGQTAELLAGSEAALLLPPGDRDALAGALVALSRAPTRLATMAEAAAIEGRRNDWTKNAAQVLEIAKRKRVAA